MAEIFIDQEALNLLQRLKEFPGEAMVRAMDQQNELTIGHIQLTRLSQRGPETLGVRTNRLRSSIRRSDARVITDTIISSIGSNVSYAGAHEFGFEGDVNVRAHTRTRKGKAHDVKEHSRHVRITARAPIRRGIQDRAKQYGEALGNAIIKSVEGQ